MNRDLLRSTQRHNLHIPFYNTKHNSGRYHQLAKYEIHDHDSSTYLYISRFRFHKSHQIRQLLYTALLYCSGFSYCTSIPYHISKNTFYVFLVPSPRYCICIISIWHDVCVEIYQELRHSADLVIPTSKKLCRYDSATKLIYHFRLSIKNLFDNICYVWVFGIGTKVWLCCMFCICEYQDESYSI